MKATIVVAKLDAAKLNNHYDFFVSAIGFEGRARHIAEVAKPDADRRLAIGFKDRHELSYSANLQWFSNAGYEIFSDADDVLFKEVLSGLLSSRPNGVSAHGCIDISSLTRSRLALVVEMLCDTDKFGSSTVDFLYTLGAYSSPPEDVAPNTHFGPISAYFSGSTIDPNKPPVAVVGLGYEEGKAIGATEYIQADEAWVFIPESPIQDYSAAVHDANKTLLDFLPKSQQIIYHPHDPVDCYFQLESLLYGIAPYGRPVILSFGPKIFSLIALLVSLRYPEASVWRVSAQNSETASERMPSEHIIGMRVKFMT